MTYSEKLRDPRWQKKRLEVMERDGFACQRCESKSKTLNVHHLVYPKGKAPWDAGNEDLVTLCEDCHVVADDQEALRRFRAFMACGYPVETLRQVASMLFCHSMNQWAIGRFQDQQAQNDEAEDVLQGAKDEAIRSEAIAAWNEGFAVGRKQAEFLRSDRLEPAVAA